MKSVKDRVLSWFSKMWDEALVYLFTFGGVIGYSVYTSRQTGVNVHQDFWSIAAAVVVSMGLAWLAENRGVKAAAAAGAVDLHVAGRRKNLVIRLFLGASFGFIGQMVLPQILDLVGRFVVGSVQGVLGGQ